MRLLQIQPIVWLLTAVFLLSSSTAATAENQRMIWADDEQPGNPIFLSRAGEESWETEAFPPSASFAANYAPCPGIGS